MLSFLPRAMLLPPMGLLLLAGLAWLLTRRGSRISHALIGVSLLGLLVLSLPLTSALLYGTLESGIRLETPGPGANPTKPPPQAIVILSGDDVSAAPSGAIFVGQQVGSLTLERMRAGAVLARRTNLPVLVTGGVLHDGAPPIADLMAQILRDEFATPVRWTEGRSLDTWENAEYSAPILAKDGITSVYLVTHPWHMRRAQIAFAHFGITVWPAPTIRDVTGLITATSFEPDVYTWVDTYFAIHEWVGCAIYALRR